MSTDETMLSWIVPLYHNGNYASELIRRAHAAAESTGLRCEIIFIDDCCPERSGQRAAEAARCQTTARVEVLRLPRNIGQDSAIREGLRACRGLHAMIIDGDLQDPPEALPLLWRRLQQTGADVIFAARHGSYESPDKLASSRIYRQAMSWLGDLPAQAGVCALLNRRAIEVVAATRVRRVSLLAALAGARLSCEGVAVLRAPRPDGRSAYSSWTRTSKAVHSLLQTIRARWLRIPL